MIFQQVAAGVCSSRSVQNALDLRQHLQNNFFLNTKQERSKKNISRQIEKADIKSEINIESSIVNYRSHAMKQGESRYAYSTTRTSTADNDQEKSNAHHNTSSRDVHNTESTCSMGKERKICVRQLGCT